MDVDDGIISVKGGLSVSSATWAENDYLNQEIASTYIKELSISGSTITITKGNSTGGGTISLPKASDGDFGLVKLGNGLKIEDNSDKLTIRTENKGLKFDGNNLAVSVDNNTIEISANNDVNNSTWTLKVKRLPKYSGQSSSHKNMVWGYADEDEESQGWLSIAAMGDMSIQEGLSLDNANVLRVSTATGTGLVFNETGQNAVLKISTGTGLAINDSNEIVVSTGAGLAFDSNNGIVVSTGIGLAFDDNKVIVSTGAGLAFDDNKVIVSTGAGLGIDDNNKVYVTTATIGGIGGFKLASADAHNSGLTMGNDAILKVNVGTGKGLEIDSSNEVTVTSIGVSSTTEEGRVSLSDGDYFYVWGMNVSGKQGWIRSHRRGNSWSGFYEGADLAEIYQSTEKLVPGDVVSIDPAKDNAIVKTKVAEDTMVAGVISTEPGVLMNQDEKGYKLALVGKVPTKVCNEGGAIKRGDLLVSASIPGYAKKAGDNPKVGTIIGKALENSDSQKGTILVLVNLQ